MPYIAWLGIVIIAYLGVGVIFWLAENSYLQLVMWLFARGRARWLPPEIQEGLRAGNRMRAVPATILDWPMWVPVVSAAVRRFRHPN